MWKRASTRRNNDDDYVGDDDDDGVGKLCPVRPCAISIYYLPPPPPPFRSLSLALQNRSNGGGDIHK